MTDQETEQPEQAAGEQAPQDGIRPVMAYDDLWEQLPEGRRGRGWSEPLILDDADDPSRPARSLINWVETPGHATAMLLTFLRPYNPVVAAYYERHMAQQNALCGRVDAQGKALPTPAAIPEEVQALLAAEFGWSLDHARDLRRAALAMFLARMAGMHPYVGDVRLVLGATDRRVAMPAGESRG